MTKLQTIKNKAQKLGLKGTIETSKSKDKKFVWISPAGKKINFGSRGMQDYLDHKDSKRREAYRKRHSAIKTKSGKRAIDIKGSPAWLSFNLLW